MTIKDVAEVVKNNCEIANAHNWGALSLCTFIIRAIELYKWEKGIKPWEKADFDSVSSWIKEKEKLWNSLLNKNFEKIKIDKKEYDPFDIEEINENIGEDYIYGAGFLGSLKPSFFLAEVKETRNIEGLKIYICGRELARDLLAPTAMLQNDEVYVRREVASFYIWSKVEEAKSLMFENALKLAFKDYNANLDSVEDVEKIVDMEIESYIWHEIGEFHEKESLEAYKKIARMYPKTKIEMFATALYDSLADLNDKGRLNFIIKNRRAGSFSFFIAGLHGYRKILLKEIEKAYWEFRKNFDWSYVDEIRKKEYAKLKELAEEFNSSLDDMNKLENIVVRATKS